VRKGCEIACGFFWVWGLSIMLFFFASTGRYTRACNENCNLGEKSNGRYVPIEVRVRTTAWISGNV
jgi:hypothetical protein